MLKRLAYRSNFAVSKRRLLQGLFNAAAESLKNVSSVTELPSQKSHRRDQGHINADSYLLRQIDLLIAVWDDLPPKSGGIGAIAREANQGGIPVIWLSTAIDFSPRLITGFDDKGDPIPSDVDCTEGPLISALKPIFDGPSLDPGRFKRVPQDALIGFYRNLALSLLFHRFRFPHACCPHKNASCSYLRATIP